MSRPCLRGCGRGAGSSGVGDEVQGIWCNGGGSALCPEMGAARCLAEGGPLGARGRHEMGGGTVPGAAAQLQALPLPSPQKQLPATPHTPHPPAHGAGAAGRSSRPQLCYLGSDDDAAVPGPRGSCPRPLPQSRAGRGSRVQTLVRMPRKPQLLFFFFFLAIL